MAGALRRWAVMALCVTSLCHAAGCRSSPGDATGDASSDAAVPTASTSTIDLATLAVERGANPDAVARTQAQLERARAEDPVAAVELLLVLALLEQAARDLDVAEQHLAHARATATDDTPPRIRGWLDAVAASLALDRNRSQDAATLAERAVEILRTTGAPRDIVHATTLLITARGMHQARFAEAFALVEDCLDTASGEELLRLRCINSRASLAYNLADYETAVGDYAEVAAPSSLLPAKLKATARMNLALCNVHLGRYAAARLAIEEALAASRVPGRTEYPEAVPLYYRGYMLSRLGDHEAAIEDYLAALALFRRDENRYFESFLLIDIGDNLLRRGLPRRAIEEYEKSLEIYSAAGNPRGVMLVEEGIGRALLDLGDDAQARRRLGRALELAGEVRDDHGWARIAAVLGDRLLRRSSPDEAEALLLRAIEVAAAKGLLEEQFRAMLGLARTLRELGRRGDALTGYRATLDLLDRIRDQLSSESQHLTFSESRHVVYRETVDLLLGTEPDDTAVAEAFAVTERARARALLELMQQARLAGATRPPERHRERLAILARLSRAHSALLAAASPPDEARVAFKTAGEELERFDLEEAARLPGVAWPRALDLEAVRRRVPPGSTLAMYWIGPGESGLWLIRDGAASFTKLASHDELVPAIEAYRAAIAREPGWQNPTDAWRAPSEALARLLRVDRVRAIADGGMLLVVPDGPLHGVPLEPLVIGDGDAGGPLLLGDLFEPVYLPSASFLELQRPDRGQDEVLRLFALGDPRAPAPTAPLPGARDEVQRIARLFDTDRAEVRLGARATTNSLREPAAAAAGILHVAARTVTREQRPEASGIALAPGEEGGDGLLRPHEIASLRLRARLTVLSACGTGLGRPVEGEGLHGLARAFLIAGVPAIVPSQWDVSDRATAELMERFYRRLVAGEPAHHALAGAARELRREALPLYAHPHYWAPFIFFGLPEAS